MTITLSPDHPLRDLRDRLTGSIVLPGDDGWDGARRAWNLVADQHPAAVAFPADTADVQALVRGAAQAGLRLAPQGTGRGARRLGGAVRGAILVRTTEMRDVQIDPQARTARVQAGAVWNDVVAAATPHGLACLHGSSGGVGVVGYTLGGGLGWMARRYGLAAQHVTAIELVDAAGYARRVTPADDPELFWALRGAGGTFGIVTAIEFELVPVTRAFAGMTVWDAADAERVLPAWRDWCVSASDDVTSVLRWLQLPPIDEVPPPLRGRLVLAIEAAHLADAATAAAELAPLREIGTPIMDTFADVPAPALAMLHGDPEEPSAGYGAHRMLGGLSDAALVALNAAAQSGHRLISIEIRQLGGALRRPQAPTPAPMDGAEFALYALGSPMTGSTPEQIEAELDTVLAAAAPSDAGVDYLNFSERQSDPARAFAPEVWQRLREIKRRVDPTDRIVSAHPVPAR